MGFVTDMKGRKREKHTRQPPYTQIQDASLVIPSDPMQDKPKNARMEHGSEVDRMGAKGTCTRQEHRIGRKEGTGGGRE